MTGRSSRQWWPDGGWHVVGPVIAFILLSSLMGFYVWWRQRGG